MRKHTEGRAVSATGGNTTNGTGLGITIGREPTGSVLARQEAMLCAKVSEGGSD